MREKDLRQKRKEKTLLFSLTHRDFELEFFRGTGPGGQSKNKVETCARIRHLASGAVAEGQEFKSQGQNREAAFKRLTNSKKFRNWLKLETARRLLNYQSIEKMIQDGVDKALQNKNLKFEVRDEHGKWIEVTSEFFDQAPELNDIISDEEIELLTLEATTV